MAAKAQDNLRARPTLAPDLSVGYYGRIAQPNRIVASKVHVHRRGNGPICGAHLHPEMYFHWCSYSDVGYVDCQRCKQALGKAGLNA